eukprot:6203706-Pleurochrysis_carterae.AAC.2
MSARATSASLRSTAYDRQGKPCIDGARSSRPRSSPRKLASKMLVNADGNVEKVVESVDFANSPAPPFRHLALHACWYTYLDQFEVSRGTAVPSITLSLYFSLR